MQPLIVDSASPASQIELAGAESVLKAKLPKDYKAFLSRTNGGRPLPNVLRPLGRQSRSLYRVRRFFSIGGKETLDLRVIFRKLASARAIPPGTIPIADDDGGNFYLLAGGGSKQDGVFFWELELDVEPALRGDDVNLEKMYQSHRTVHLAASFCDFLNSFADVISPKSGTGPGAITMKWAEGLCSELPDLGKAKELLSAGADPDSYINGSGDTMLHRAAGLGNIPLTKLLVLSGANINAINAFGRTPLHYAAQGGRRGIIRVLVDAGANPRIKDRLGDTPISLWGPSGAVLFKLSGKKNVRRR